jgi:hypothetical protein
MVLLFSSRNQRHPSLKKGSFRHMPLGLGIQLDFAISIVVSPYYQERRILRDPTPFWHLL